MRLSMLSRASAAHKRFAVRWRTAAAVALGTAASAVGAATLTFDTPTATTSETEAIYGLSAGVNLTSALVVDGELRLDAVGGFNGTLDFGTFEGDFGFAFDTRISTTPGYVNVGFHVGNTSFYFHPGYWDHYFINDGFAGQMGFIPDWQQMTHVAVDVDASAKSFAVTLSQGANSYTLSYVDIGYLPGTSPFGFTAGSVPGAEFYGVFDNLAVSLPVPEPAPLALLTAGLAGLALRHRSRRLRAALAGAGAAGLLCATVVPAQAAVVVLYDEAVGGDLGPSSYLYGGTPPVFALGAGTSVLSGALSAGPDRFGNFSTDVDAFDFIVDVGYELAGVWVNYTATATRGGATMPPVMNFMYPDHTTVADSIAEYFIPQASGTETLFDTGGQPFRPIGHGASPAEFYLRFMDDQQPSGTSYVYQYTLALDVRRVADSAAVPEPDSLALAGSALAALLVGRAPPRRRRGTQRPEGDRNA